MSLRTAALVLPFLLVAFAFVSNRASAQACPSPTVPIRTAAERSAATIAGIPESATCWNPNDRFTGQEVAAAKQFLLSRYEIGPRSAPCIKTKEEGIEPLNPEFAVNMARLIQDMERELGGRTIVRSALRPDSCGGGVGHSKGCAIDLEYASSRNPANCAAISTPNDPWRCSSDTNTLREHQWVIRNGQSAQYRVHFPFPKPPEWHHIEPIDRAACIARTPGNVNLAARPAGAPLGIGDYARTSLANAGLANNLGLGQGYGYVQPQLPPQPALPPQPLSSGQSLTSAFQPSTSLIPQTTTQTQTQTQTNTNTNINTNENTNTATGSPISVADQLLNLAFGTVTATSGSIGTSAPIVITGAQAGTIAYVSGQNPQQFPTSTGGISPAGQNTFTSSDLANNPKWQPQQPIAPGTPTYLRLVQLYTQLRDVLARMFDYLRPFSSHRAVTAEDSY